MSEPRVAPATRVSPVTGEGDLEEFIGLPWRSTPTIRRGCRRSARRYKTYLIYEMPIA